MFYFVYAKLFKQTQKENIDKIDNIHLSLNALPRQETFFRSNWPLRQLRGPYVSINENVHISLTIIFILTLEYISADIVLWSNWHHQTLRFYFALFCWHLFDILTSFKLLFMTEHESTKLFWMKSAQLLKWNIDLISIQSVVI